METGTIYRLSDLVRDGQLAIDRRDPTEPLAAYLRRALPQMQAKLGLIAFNNDYDRRQLELEQRTATRPEKDYTFEDVKLEGARERELLNLQEEILRAANDSQIRKPVALNSSYRNHVPFFTALAGGALPSVLHFYHYYQSLPADRQNLFAAAILGLYLTLISLPTILFRRSSNRMKAEIREYGFDPTKDNIRIVEDFNRILDEINRELKK